MTMMMMYLWIIHELIRVGKGSTYEYQLWEAWVVRCHLFLLCWDSNWTLSSLTRHLVLVCGCNTAKEVHMHQAWNIFNSAYLKEPNFSIIISCFFMLTTNCVAITTRTSLVLIRLPGMTIRLNNAQLDWSNFSFQENGVGEQYWGVKILMPIMRSLGS